MFRPNRCPRCGGNLLMAGRDKYGSYLSCLQCGRNVELPPDQRHKQPTPRKIVSRL